MRNVLYIVREVATFERTFADRIRYIGGSVNYNEAHAKLEQIKKQHDVIESNIDSFTYISDFVQPIYGSNILPTARASVRVSIIEVPYL